jgi:hypothetical protein
MVRMEEAGTLGEGVIGLLENEVFTPDIVDVERVTGELKPPRDVTVMVDVPDEPMLTVREVGRAEMEKSGVDGGATTVRLMVTFLKVAP